MSHLRRFGPDDVFSNRLQTHPEYTITLYSGSHIINNHRYDGDLIITSSFVNTNTTSSFLNAFELNIDNHSASYYNYGDQAEPRVPWQAGEFTGRSGELVRSPANDALASSSYHRITPFIIKDNSGHRFRGMSLAEYNRLQAGTVMTGAYPYTSSIDREYIPPRQTPWRATPQNPSHPGQLTPYNGWATIIEGGNNLNNGPVPGAPLWNRPVDNPNSGYQSTDAYFSQSKRIIALRNVLNNYKILSPAFEYSSSVPSATGLHKPFLTGALSLISIPSVFYDSGIKRGSVRLEFFYTGSLLDVAVDEKENGELISTMNDTSGSVVGVVLYNEGFIILTSTTPILGSSDDVTDSYDGQLLSDGGGNPAQVKPRWTYFGSYNTSSNVNDYPAYPSASLFNIIFKGTNRVPTMTMFANAPAGQYNNSNNPTWISSSYSNWRDITFIGSGSYMEPREIAVKNISNNEYCNTEENQEDFEKQVFISKIGVYDENKNLIGIAKLANPVLKKEADSLTFKLKLDL